MKVLVIGATGATGQHAVRKLLARGDDVTAFARNPAAVTEKHDRLKIAQGDARDAGSLDRAMQGQDAVFAAFGPRSLKRDDLAETFMRNLLAAMKKHGVRRLVNLSAWGAGDSAPNAVFFFKIVKATILRNVFADKDRGEALLVASDIDYVNVRPGRLIDEPARGGVKTSMDGRGIKPLLTRADLADFMIEQLSGDTWVRKSPIVGY
jgi:uncharacterized protein YbjT (DUF2867 family)